MPEPRRRPAASATRPPEMHTPPTLLGWFRLNLVLGLSVLLLLTPWPWDRAVAQAAEARAAKSSSRPPARIVVSDEVDSLELGQRESARISLARRSPAAAGPEPAKDRPSVRRAAGSPAPRPGIRHAPLPPGSPSIRVQQPAPASELVAHVPDQYEAAPRPRAARSVSSYPSELRFLLTPEGPLPRTQPVELSSTAPGREILLASEVPWLEFDGRPRRIAPGEALELEVGLLPRLFDPAEERFESVLRVRTVEDETPLGTIRVLVERAAAPRELVSRDAEGRPERRLRADGSRVEYRYHASGGLESVEGPHLAVRFTYDSKGRRVGMHDALGTTTYGYDSEGRLSEVRPPGLPPMRYHYGGDGRLQELAYPDGRRVAYRWDPAGRLLEAGPARYRWEDGRLVEIELDSGLSSTFAYEASGALASVEHRAADGATLLAYRASRDGAGRLRALDRAGAGGGARYEMDARGRLERIAEAGGRSTTFERDAEGRIRRRVHQDPGEARASSVAEFRYSRDGRLLEAGEERFVWDLLGRLEERRSPGRTVRYAYDAEDRLVRVEADGRSVVYGYDGDGRRVLRRAEGLERRILFDASGLFDRPLMALEPASERWWSFGQGLLPFDLEAEDGARGLLLAGTPLAPEIGRIDPRGHALALLAPALGVGPESELPAALLGAALGGATYDPATGLLHVEGRDFDPQLGLFLDGREKGAAPDLWAEGMLGTLPGSVARVLETSPDRSPGASEKDPSETRHASSLLSNQLPASSRAGGGRTSPLERLSQLREPHRYQRGRLGPRVASPELRPHPEYLNFLENDLGLLPVTQDLRIRSSNGESLPFTVSEEIPWLDLETGSGTASAEPAVIPVTVDTTGLSSQESPYLGEIVLQNSLDPDDQRVVRVRLTVVDGHAWATLHSLGANDELERVVRPDGSILDYERDDLGRLLAKRLPDGSSVGYTYDGNGNRTTMTDARGTTVYEYDGQNRLSAIFAPGQNPLRYEYDPAGQLRRIVYPDLRSVDYTYDDDGRMLSATGAEGPTTYAYDPASGRLVGQTLPNGIATTYGYDLDGRLTDVEHRDGSGALLCAFRFTLDANGNRTEVARETPAGTEQTSFAYDEAQRLSQADYPDGRTVQYGYDGDGKRISSTTIQDGQSEVATYEYDADNRLLRAGEVHYLYDEHGNRTRAVGPDRVEAFAYDAENRLIRWSSGDEVVEYLYDGDGNRAGRIENGRRTDFVIHPGGVSQVLIETDEQGSVERAYTYGLERLSLETASGARAYYLHESPGRSVAFLADDAGQEMASYGYDAFGSTRSQSGQTLGNTFQFNAEAVDPANALVHLRSRDLDPATGQFLTSSPDPALPTSPEGQLKGAFVDNNPVNRTDPTGRQAWCLFDGCYNYVGRGNNGENQPPVSFFDSAGALHDTFIATGDGFVSFVFNVFLDPTTSLADFRLAADAFKGALCPQCPLSQERLEELASRGNVWAQEQLKLPESERGFTPEDGPVFNVLDRLVALGAVPLFAGIGLLKLGVGLITGLFEGLFSLVSGLFSGLLGALGGVSLNQTAELLLELDDITGATYDERTGQLVLLGREDVSLPAMEPDDVAVAVASVLGGQDPGVSIEPPIVGGQMSVRFEGATLDTYFGYLMFEADRVLKSYALGRDNLTGAAVSSAVPGYRSMLSRRLQAGCSSVPDSTRMWFQPKEVRLVRSADGRSMVFDSVAMELLWETKVGNQVVSDPQAAAFAQHFTENYALFAAEQPVLQELERLGKIVAVVKWIEDHEIPVDLSFLADYVVELFATPRTTPAITVQATSGLCTISLRGGVSYLPPNEYLEDDPVDPLTDALREEALAGRPSDLDFSWDFEPSATTRARLGGGGTTTTLKAVAQSFARSPKDGALRFRETDLDASAPGSFRLGLVRYYDSFADRAGDLGPGWDHLPLGLRFPTGRVRFTFGSQNLERDLYPELSLLDRPEGRERSYLLLGLDSGLQPIYLASGVMHQLRELDDGRFELRKRGGARMRFDPEGRLLEVVDAAGISLEYRYDPEGRLESIVAEDGRAITLSHDAAGRLSEAQGPGGRSLRYSYDAAGRLAEVRRDELLVRSYGYDPEDRLVSIHDGEGQAILESSADPYGRSLAPTAGGLAAYQLDFDLREGRTEIVDSRGGRSMRWLDPEGRLLAEVDALGRRLEVQYDEDFGPAQVIDPRGARTERAHDSRGNLTEVRDASGGLTRLYYDWRDLLVASSDPEGLETAYGYDSRGLLTAIYHSAELELDAEGNLLQFFYDASQVTSMVYDEEGRLAEVIDPLGRIEKLFYDPDGQLERRRSPAGVETEYRYDARGRLESLECGQRQIGFTYDDRSDQPTAYATAAGSTSFERDATGRLLRIEDAETGSVRYEYGAGGQLERVVSPGEAAIELERDSEGRVQQVLLPEGRLQRFEYDLAGRPVASLSGLEAAARPRLATTPGALAFGPAAVGTVARLELHLLNQGRAPLELQELELSAPFELETLVGPGTTLAPGELATLVVRFVPEAAGSFAGELSLESDDPAAPTLTLPLSGTGILQVVGLAARPVPDGIELTWAAFDAGSQSLDHFRIYRSTSPLGPSVDGLTALATLSDPAATAFVDETALYGETYHYAVTPVLAGGLESTDVVPAGPVTYFNAVEDLTAEREAGGIRLTWSPFDPGRQLFSRFLVYRSQAPIPGTVAGLSLLATSLDDPAATSILDTSAVHGESYYYAVTAEMAGGLEHPEVVPAGPVSFFDASLGFGPLGPALPVATAAESEQRPVLAARGQTGESLLVYERDRFGDGSDVDVLAQRLGADGSPLGAPVAVADSPLVERAPHVAYNSLADEFLVLFDLDREGDGSDFDVLGRRLAGDSTPAGPIFVVGDLLSNGVRVDDQRAAVAYNPVRDQYFAVLEVDPTGEDSDLDIVGLVLDAGGGVVGDVVLVGGFLINGVSVDERLATIAYNSTAEQFLVVFQVDTLGDGGSNLNQLAVRLHPTGVRLGAPFFVGSTSLSSTGEVLQDRHARAAYDPVHNEYLVVWDVAGTVTLDHSAILAQKVAADGTTGLGAGLVEVAFSSGLERRPRAAFSPAFDEAVVLWEADQDLFARRLQITASSLLLGGAFPVAESPDAEGMAAVAHHPTAQETLAVWERSPIPGGLADLEARRLGYGPSALGVDPLALDFGTTETSLPITIENLGLGSLEWTSTVDAPWISLDPSSGTTSGSAQAEVRVERTSLAVGAHTGMVTIDSNGGQAQVSISLEVENRPPLPPDEPSPADGALSAGTAGAGGTVSVALGWQGEDTDGDNLLYDLYLSTDAAAVQATAGTALLAAGLSQPAFSAAGLAFQSTYAWRVVARDPSGAESQGPAWSFSTLALPAPQLHPVQPDPGNDPRPLLSWHPVPGAESYRLQVAGEPSFSAPSIEESGLLATEYLPGTDLAEGTWYWRVAGERAGGTVGPFSAADSFELDLTPPAVPAPVPGPSLGNDPRPTLEWDAVAGAVTYRLQVADAAGFGTPIVDLSTAETSHRPAEDLPEGEILWRVAGTDAAGNASAFSAPASFTLDLTAPAPVSGLSVERQGEGAALAWTPEAPADFARWHVYRSLEAFSNSSGLSPLAALSGDPDLDHYLDTTADPGTGYFYAVAAVDQAGNEDREVSSVELPANGAPAEPSAPSPADGATGQLAADGSTDLPLTWSASDPDGDPLRFDVYLSTDAALVEALDLGARVAAGLTRPSFMASGLGFDLGYHWRVLALDPGGAATAGPVWSFTTGAMEAPLLTPVSPDPGNDPRPTLAWQAVPGAVDYQLQVAADPSFAAPILDVGGLAGLDFVPEDDLPEGTLHWRARAFDPASQAGPFSAADSFTIDRTPPEAPELDPVLPDPGNDPRPSLSWSSVPDAELYRLQVATDPGFVALVLEHEGPEVSFTPSEDLPEGTLSWRVASRDAAGNWSDPSAADSFTIDRTPPEAPQLDPVLPDPGNDPRPELGWSGTADSVLYRLELALDPLFATPLLVETLEETVFVPAEDLEEGTYHWRVSARDAAGNWSTPSAADSFSIDLTPLPPVAGLGVERVGASIVLSWEPIAPAPDFGRFHIYRETQPFATVAGLTPLDTSLTDPSATGWEDPSAEPGVTYHYAVTAVDLAGNEDPSAPSATTPEFLFFDGFESGDLSAWSPQ